MTLEGKKVLVVDDEMDVLQYVKAVLEDDGYKFVTAQDGEAAVQKVRAEKPDLVILDVQMPKKDGFQVFYEIRNDDTIGPVPVIMLTAVGQRTGLKFNAKDMGEYLGDEPEAYIDKPIDPEKLRETARKLIEASAGE